MGWVPLVAPEEVEFNLISVIVAANGLLLSIYYLIDNILLVILYLSFSFFPQYFYLKSFHSGKIILYLSSAEYYQNTYSAHCMYCQGNSLHNFS
jgi:hypothetical protein